MSPSPATPRTGSSSVSRRSARCLHGHGFPERRPRRSGPRADDNELVFSGTLPANLPGIWNHSNDPPWRCDYHTDVNVQMNYWFTGPANLTECFTPLSEWLWSVVPVKREATREKYGVRGWVHRSENGIFGGQSYHWVPGDAPWLLQNIWDHYAITLGRQYLESRAYPLLKEQCGFWEDSLIERPDGTLVSPKSVSPEHGPEAQGNSCELLKEQIHGNFYGNLLSFHPPFQIDGNFGYAAGVCEMFVQSHAGTIHILPALPDVWPSGRFTGLRARGGFEIDIAWRDGELAEVPVRSLKGRPLSLLCRDKTLNLPTEPGAIHTYGPMLELKK